jgi:hypothetical protein
MNKYYHDYDDDDITILMNETHRKNYATNNDSFGCLFKPDESFSPTAIVTCSHLVWTVILLNKETGGYDNVTYHCT